MWIELLLLEGRARPLRLLTLEPTYLLRIRGLLLLEMVVDVAMSLVMRRWGYR
jgi:hypothetical protein